MEKQPCAPSVGADIEAFVFNSEENKHVPCVGLLPGTKNKPHPLENLKEGYAVQEDNVMAEFNIPPATSGVSFKKHIHTAKTKVEGMLPKGHLLDFTSSVKFKPIDLTSTQAKLIGCEPDFDAYTGGRVRLNVPSLGLDRGAGGHVHIGGDFQCPDFVAALFAEVFLGVLVDLRPNKKDARAKWYGLPGVYRPKPYGIEYRTPSCEWAKNPEQTEIVGENALICSRWLSLTPANVLQTVFRNVKWTEVRNHMKPPKDNQSSTSRSYLIKHLRNAGVPL